MSKMFNTQSPDLESAADEALADMDAEAAKASEVHFRIQKANYYLTIINDPLFSDGAPEAALEVEAEIRQFADTQLRKFLGMDAPAPRETAQTAVVAAKLPFDDEQLQALIVWANRLLKREASVVPQPVATTEATAPVVRNVAPAQPTLQARGAESDGLSQFRRRPGRPPGTGKHQKAAAAAAAQQQAQVAPKAEPAAPKAPADPNDVPKGEGIPPNLERGADGNFYQNVEYIKDGKVVKAKVIWQPPVKSLGAQQPVPYATPQQMQNPPLSPGMVVSGGQGRTAGLPPELLDNIKNRFFNK